MISLHKILENTIDSVRQQWLLGGRERHREEEEQDYHEKGGLLGDDGYVYYLDCGNVFISCIKKKARMMIKHKVT